MRALIIVVLCLAQPAYADVGKDKAGFFESYYGKTSDQVIAALGPPDYVIVPGDKSEWADDLSLSGVAKHMFWKVRGCQPVVMDFDRHGKATGVDYSAFAQGGRNCSKELEKLIVLPNKFSCSQPDREPKCH